VSGAFVDAPDSRHPGSLSESDLQENRRQAAALFQNASAGKTWRQGQIGLTLRSEGEEHSWQATVYGTARSLHNPLPFADIEVDRLMAGTRVTVQGGFGFIRWGVGVDGAIQSDDRRNYGYVGNFERGPLTIDQQETVLNGAVSGRLATDFRRFNVSAGLRADVIRFENDDRLLAGGEDRSGSRNFHGGESLGRSVICRASGTHLCQFRYLI
jgi:iron complex outermembrane recepter protein